MLWPVILFPKFKNSGSLVGGGVEWRGDRGGRLLSSIHSMAAWDQISALIAAGKRWKAEKVQGCPAGRKVVGGMWEEASSIF